MIVRDDYSRGSVCYCISEDFTWMNRASINEADGNHVNINYFIRSINRRAQKVFLFSVTIVTNQRQNVSRPANLETLRLDASASKLNSGDNQSAFGISHSIELFEVFDLDSQPFFINYSRQFSCQGHHVHCGRAFA